jgi:acyl-CoA synthetase (AMP-forming)/AMP-acid ligase II
MEVAVAESSEHADRWANLIRRVNVGDSLTRAADRNPAGVAVVDGPRRWTYREFNDWVNGLAHGLASHGYRTGDALAIASGNSAEFLAVYYACAKLGLVCVPINLGWRPEEVAHVLGHSGARGLVVETQLIGYVTAALDKVPEVADILVAPGTGAPWQPGPDRQWTELAAAGSGRTDEPEFIVDDRAPITYLYTSGTTSLPKGVVGNHTAIFVESMAMALEARFGPDDRFAAMMPMFHTAQLNCFCTPAVMVGATIYVLRGFDAPGLLELIESERITQIFGLPMMYRAMLDHPDMATRDTSSLRRACYAMAPMPDDQLRRAIETFGCDFYLMFGQTEMSPGTTMFRPEHQLSHSGAVGTPLVSVQAAIMDADGTLLPQGETGEIVYRSPHALTEYLKNPEATAEAFAHGWFHSGDVGHFDSDGILWFTDRRKDVIKTGGENVASIEVEKAIYSTDPRVAEVAVVGLPHAHWSEAITAVVVPRPGESIDPDELREKLAARLDRYKIPKAILVAEELPKTSTGKIQKNVLRTRFETYYSDQA